MGRDGGLSSSSDIGAVSHLLMVSQKRERVEVEGLERISEICVELRIWQIVLPITRKSIVKASNEMATVNDC